jgi:cytochrome c oxidase accessory protein FixG
MSDDDTINIGYDEVRGEPRGAKGKVEGDCIDCRRCVTVCPTGIDIRNGLQMECIGCTACIDACDEIMVKIDRPKGLVRYDSLNGLSGKKRRLLRPRVFAYTFLGLLGLGAFAFTASRNAKPFTAQVSKVAMAGQPFQADAVGVRNFYQLRFFNKRNVDATCSVELIDPPAGMILSGGGQETTVGPRGEVTRQIVAISPIDSYQGRSTLTFRVTANPGNVVMEQRAAFLGPNPETLDSP